MSVLYEGWDREQAGTDAAHATTMSHTATLCIGACPAR